MIISSEKDSVYVLQTAVTQEAKIFINAFVVLLFFFFTSAVIFFGEDPLMTKLLHFGIAIAISIVLIFVIKFLILFITTMFKITATIDMSKDLLTIKENGRKAHYQISAIRSIKSTLNGSRIFQQNHSKLVFVLKNGEHIEAVSATLATFLFKFPFAFDYFANQNHDIGKAIAQVIRVPFTEGEYQL